MALVETTAIRLAARARRCGVRRRNDDDDDDDGKITTASSSCAVRPAPVCSSSYGGSRESSTSASSSTDPRCVSSAIDLVVEVEEEVVEAAEPSESAHSPSA